MNSSCGSGDEASLLKILLPLGLLVLATIFEASFATWPTLPILVGGAFIRAGGTIITAWQR